MPSLKDELASCDTTAVAKLAFVVLVEAQGDAGEWKVIPQGAAPAAAVAATKQMLEAAKGDLKQSGDIWLTIASSCLVNSPMRSRAMLDISGKETALLSASKAGKDQPEAAIQAGEEAFFFFKRAKDKVSMAAAMQILSVARSLVCQPEEALRLSKSAAELSEGAKNPVAQAAALCSVAQLHLAANELPEALEAVESALAAPLPSKLPFKSESLALSILTKVQIARQDFRRAKEEATSNRKLCEEKGDKCDKVFAQVLCATALCASEEFKEASDIAEKAYLSAVESGEKLAQAASLQVLAEIRGAEAKHGLAQPADKESAAELATRASVIFGEANDPLCQAQMMAMVSQVHLDKGDCKGAVDMAKRSVELLKDQKDSAGQAASLTLLAEMQIKNKAYSEGAKAAKSAQKLCTDLGDEKGWAKASELLSTACSGTGDTNQAIETAMGLMTYYKSQGAAKSVAKAELTFTTAAIAELKASGVKGTESGELAKMAMIAVREAITIYEESGEITSHAQALAKRAELHVVRGAFVHAGSVGKEAYDLFKDCGDKDGQKNALVSMSTAWLMRAQRSAEYGVTKSDEAKIQFDTAHKFSAELLTLAQNTDDEDAISQARNIIDAITECREILGLPAGKLK
eukprot:gnl/TRDRNA2_/TRDRNA2_176040_c3_seq1.p1 gnl/TRDRNA2_/TRDRNA2_176040_c3~~gnl/TRDRNA2_/TRDRNA2_176040_c3_seq1.p1  ORF type:complete len:633 (-),score=194.81 gnl/TRDRNA2_/TRDRNA2_176040_c3_seq1:546-2444(-)